MLVALLVIVFPVFLSLLAVAVVVLGDVAREAIREFTRAHCP